MKVKFYNSYQQFVEHNSIGGIFDLNKYETNIGERIQNENYQEQSYKKKTNDMSLSSQPHTKKKARQYEKRANIVKTFIRDKRDKSQREHIFRTFMRVHRSIPDELRTIKPHRLSPTLFLDVPYRSISKRNIPDSKGINASTGQYKSVHMHINMIMCYQWGLILHYMTSDPSDRTDVLKLLNKTQTPNETDLNTTLKKLQGIQVQGGSFDNIKKMLELYNEYKVFSTYKLKLIDVDYFNRLLKNPDIVENGDDYSKYGRPYTKKQMALDFIEHIKNETGFSGNSVDIKDYLYRLLQNMNWSRMFLQNVIKLYPNLLSN